MLTKLKLYKESLWWESALGVGTQIRWACDAQSEMQVDESVFQCVEEDIYIPLGDYEWWRMTMTQLRIQEGIV